MLFYLAQYYVATYNAKHTNKEGEMATATMIATEQTVASRLADLVFEAVENFAPVDSNELEIDRPDFCQ